MNTDGKDETILLVDDEEAVRRPVRRKLAKEGYDCLEAACAGEAQDQLRANRVAMAFLDVMMPGKSGVALLPELRDEFPDTAVVMATAVVDPNVIIQCMRDGAQDYIVKPFELNEVLRCIHRVLSKRKLEIVMKEYQMGLEGRVEEQEAQMRTLFLGGIESLIAALEAKDEYTAGHSKRVSAYSLAIADRMGLPESEREDIRWGSLLHDVGKVAIDPSIQNKPGKLTEQEYSVLMSHAQVGPRIVKPIANEYVLEIIRLHHTRYDGRASDQPLVGEQIPIGARIVTLADSFDAMTSDRPYRKAMALPEALFEVRRCAGMQFDPAVVDAFSRIPLSDLQSLMANGIAAE